jgi:hypothetical protein
MLGPASPDRQPTEVSFLLYVSEFSAQDDLTSGFLWSAMDPFLFICLGSPFLEIRRGLCLQTFTFSSPGSTQLPFLTWLSQRAQSGR